MEPTEMRGRVQAARVGRLATVTAEQRPHVVPCCFALVGDAIVSAVDAKPKTTRTLRRLDNIRSNPAAALLVDHYDEEWGRLWWVRVDGTATVVDGGAERGTAIGALQAKYPQYRRDPPPGPVIVIRGLSWRAWP